MLVGGIVAIGIVVNGSLINSFHVTYLPLTSLCGDTGVGHRRSHSLVEVHCLRLIQEPGPLPRSGYKKHFLQRKKTHRGSVERAHPQKQKGSNKLLFPLPMRKRKEEKEK